MPKKIEKTPAKAVDNKKVVVSAPKVIETKLVKYSHKNIKISPRKLRLLANDVKKLSPTTALTQLKFTNTKSARVLVSAIESLLADAKNNHQVKPETLKFDSIRVDEGLKIKRMDKSHGSRFARGIILKRHSRLLITAKGELN